MDRRPRRKFDHERIIYVTIDFALDIVKNVAKGLFQELQRNMHNHSLNSRDELIETSKDLIARIDIPAVRKEDIDIDLNEKKLEIRISHIATGNDGVINHTGRNINLKKEIKLPKIIVVEDSYADIEDGILTVTMPKKIKRIRYEVE